MNVTPGLRLAAWLLLVTAPALAHPLEAGAADQPLGPQAGFLLDPGGALGVDQVLAQVRSGALARFDEPIRSFGPTSAALWLHVEVVGGAGGADLALTWDRPLVDELDVWVVRAFATEHLRGGLAVPSSERTILHQGPYHLAPFRLAPGERADLLVRARSSRILLAEAHLRSASTVQRRDMWLGGYLGFIGGIVALVVFLAAWSWWSLRDRWSLRLTAVLATFAGYLGSETGLLATLWPDQPRLWAAAPSVAALGCAVFGLAYSRAFVAADARVPRLDRLVVWVQRLGAAAMLVPLIHPATGAVVAILAVAVTFSFMMLLGVLVVRTGNRPARFFLASASIMSGFGLFYLLALLGLGPATGLTLGGFQVAMWVGGVVLLLSHFDRVDVERGVAQARLEAQVAERTTSLREAEERFRLAFTTSPDSINFTLLADGTYVAVNQGFTRMTGWTEADVIGRSAVDLGIWVDPAERAVLVAGLQAAGRVENQECRFRCKDGRQLVSLLSAQVLPVGGVPHILSVTRDVTAWKQAEADRDRLADELRQAQKLEAIGRLAGGVAHDFNNLLTAVSTNASLSLLDLPPDDRCRDAFQEILEASGRATALTRQLLAFSRRQVIAPRPTDLVGLVQGLAGMLRRLLGEDVTLEVAPAGPAPAVLADPGQVEQVLVNLAINARDALPRGGRIVVSTEQVEVAGGGEGRPAGRYGAVLVRDDGPGIDPEVLPHIFEPFFTTKHGKGTGLGLATVYGIATQHGGFVEVDSASGRGATFRVAFPLAAAPAEPLAITTASQGALPGGRETILLAEDEPAVRHVARALLERLGYRVLAAADGLEAEVLAVGCGGAFDLLLSDVVMPGLDGRALAERLRTRWPGLPVVLMSGYTQDVLERGGGPVEGFLLVDKPFEPWRLAEVLRRALDKPRPRPGQ
ncbi:MAG: PAS domain S-box protein [Anaeromyxobacter sp.]|nr:PAS domain S-box protein [Anaeromyxobacter sp.]